MSYDCDDMEAADLYNEKTLKARKDHKCSACHEIIKIGMNYTRVFIAFEGSATTIKRCNRCQSLHLHLRKLAPGERWPDERLNCGETYQDEWECDPPPEIAALAFALPNEVNL